MIFGAIQKQFVCRRSALLGLIAFILLLSSISKADFNYSYHIDVDPETCFLTISNPSVVIDCRGR